MSAPNDVHPHDLALLYDLVDGRLAPRAADELARRLDEEPELRAVHAGILALRHRLATLSTPALPADFLERVRAKAGFPAPVAVAVARAPRNGSIASARTEPARSAAADASSGDPSSGDSTSSDPTAGRTSDASGPAPAYEGGSGTAPAARLLAFTRFAYAAAALIVVALGVFVYTQDLPATERAPGTTGATETADGRGRADPERVDRAESAEKARRAMETGPSDVPAPSGGGALDRGAPEARRPFAPGGAIAPGVRDSGTGRERVPSEPSVPAASPAAPPAGPVAAPDPSALAAGTGDDAAGIAAADKRKESGLGSAPGSGSGATGRTGGGGGGVGGDSPRGARAGKPGSDRPSAPRVVVPAAVFDGADDVLVVYADSYDAARAEVTLLVADARLKRTLDATRVGAGRKALAAPQDDAKSKVLDGSDRRSAAPTPHAVEAPLGTFFVDLDDASLARLAGALDSGVPARGDAEPSAGLEKDAEGLTDADAAATTGAPPPGAAPEPDAPPQPAALPPAPATPAEPSAAPKPAAAPAAAPAPPTSGAKAGAGGDAIPAAERASGGEVRRVRIVVLRRD